MNRSFFSKILISLSIVSGLFLTGCNDPIFSEIRDEVSLTESKVAGDIKSIIRYQDLLYVTNGDIMIKDPSYNFHTPWIKTLAPLTGSAYNLAADKDYLYAIAVLFVDNGNGYNIPTYRYIYYYKDNSWNLIQTYTYNATEEFVLFCTNSPNPEHRKAFVRVGTTVYELNGANMKAVTTSDYGTVSQSARSCIWFKGTAGDGHNNIVFSDSVSITSNETKYTDSTILYKPTGSFIGYSTDGTNWNYLSMGTDDIYTVAYTSDFLMLGTEEGIAHSAITDGIPYPGTTKYLTNADSALSSYYEIWALLAVNPEKSEYETVSFAATDFSGSSSSTSASTKNIGLWGYYPSDRKWNRE